MANLDYPGPCPSCSGISGCSMEADTVAVKKHCKGLEQELSTWKTRMYEDMVAFENADPANHTQTRDTLVLLQSHIREIDGILGKLEQECSMDLMDVANAQDTACVSPGWLGG